MVWVRTLAQLVTDVTTRCDVDGYVARHPPASVRRLVEESYQRLRELMTSAGSRRFIGGPFALSSNTRGDTGYGNIFPLSTTVTPGPVLLPLERPISVEAKIASQWVELKSIGFGDVHDWFPAGSVTNRPEAWTLLGLGAAPIAAGGYGADPVFDETNNGGQFSILIVPHFDIAAYPIQVWASPVITITDADNTTLTLDGPGFEWIIWDVVIKISSRDNDSQGTFAIANQERTKAEILLRDAIRSENKTSPQRRDVFHGSRMGRYRRGGGL